MEEEQAALLKFSFEQFQALRKRSIGRLIWRLKRHLHADMEPQLQARGYTNFKMGYVMFLANIDENGTTNTELAKLAGVSKQAMSKVASELETGGYIYTQPHEKDARATLLFLNERGKALFEDLHVVVGAIHDKFSRIVGQERMDQLIETLLELNDALDEESQK